MADDEVTDEVAEARKTALARAGAGATSPVEDHVQADYFGAGQEFEVTLPDGVSTITHKTFMEGDKRQYMNLVNRDLVINQQTRDARLKMAPGDDRYNLLKNAIVGWNLLKDGKPLPFNANNLDAVLKNFPPHVLDVVEADIRKKNPWLTNDISIEDIEKNIVELTELLETKKAEQEGNGGSSS